MSSSSSSTAANASANDCLGEAFFPAPSPSCGVLGLLDNARAIGTRLAWEERLAQFKVTFQGHSLVHRSLVNSQTSSIKIDRHKAAISRNDFSKPMRFQWLWVSTSFFEMKHKLKVLERLGSDRVSRFPGFNLLASDLRTTKNCWLP